MAKWSASMVELSVGLIVTCIAPSATFVRHFLDKRTQSRIGDDNDRSSAMQHEIPLARRRRHAPGGLSELDSMKTFGSTVDTDKSLDSVSMKEHLTMNASPCGTAF
jgi:hypothetical protein